MRISDGENAEIFNVPSQRSNLAWQSEEKLNNHLDNLPHSFWIYKKALDLFFAILLLPGLLFCVVILLIFNPFKNPGPIFFKQKRVGLNGKEFTIYKFRTVVNPGIEQQLSEDQQSKLSTLGAFMRDTRVDEVPQILNVLKGDMSMIGPRPEQVSLYQEYSDLLPGFSLRQKSKPGITGLAQLKYGYTHDLNGAASKLRWDLIYLNQLGFRSETFLATRTFSFVMARLSRILLLKLMFWRS
jgi:lipopolysaccharide/colanic/teichoic acid biosynthesis glycosyltransferase